MRFKRFVVFLMLGLATSVTGAAGIRVGDRAPNFSIEMLDGEWFTLAEWRGKKPVLMFFFMPWCADTVKSTYPETAEHCQVARERILSLYERFGGSVEFVGVASRYNNDTASTVRYLEEFDIRFPVAFDMSNVAHRVLSVRSFPTQIVVDENGVIRYRLDSAAGDLEEVLDSLTGG